MGHGHSHGHFHADEEGEYKASPRVRRALLIAVVPFIVMTLVGLVILWPGEPPGRIEGDFINPERVGATVTNVEEIDCQEIPGQESFRCAEVTARIDEGDRAGSNASFETAETSQARQITEGDKIFVGRSLNDPNEDRYFFLDYQRSLPLLALGVLFAVVVIALSGLRGVAALVGLAVSLLVLLAFVLPAILEGKSPIAVAAVGSAAIMFAALYMAHGINVRTTTAILGTLVSLVLTCLLAAFFLDIVSFTGFGSEEAVFLQVSAAQVNLQGLIFAGVIIGTLGVLDDVTVTQASAVWEIHYANPRYSARQLYSRALRIGRDHIASTVNTLVLAYAGASLPLLILFSLADVPLTQTLTSEVVAQEIVRTLVGSIGLVASVPITTGLAALVVSRDETKVSAARRKAAEERLPDSATEPDRIPDAPGYKRPRAERMFRDEK
ncbi:MAG: YibE/F family protein [Actinomycetota bacterium]